jgi:hypothetical protein
MVIIVPKFNQISKTYKKKFRNFLKTNKDDKIVNEILGSDRNEFFIIKLLTSGGIK